MGAGKRLSEGERVGAFLRSHPYPAIMSDRVQRQFDGLSHMKCVGSILRFPNLKARAVLDDEFVSFFGEDRADALPFRNASPNLVAAVAGIRKYDKPQPEIEAGVLYTLRVWCDRMYGPHVRESGLCSWERAFSGMDLSTSPGAMWSKGHFTKGDALNEEDSFCKIFDMAVNYGNRSWPRTIWQSSLKEETRSLEKLKLNKIRQFSACGIAANIAGRYACLNQNEAFYESNLKTWSAVGVNPRKGGWARVLRTLSAHDKGWDLDLKEYDSSIGALLLQNVCTLRKEWLIREGADADRIRILENFYEDLINSVYMDPSGHILIKYLGNPSGSPNTVVDNTLVLTMLLMLSWIRTCGDDYSEMMDNISPLLYGDDHTLTVSEEYRDRFNYDSIKEVFASVGITVKVPTSGPSARPARELTFLSHGFTVLSDRVVLCRYLRPDKLLASLAFRNRREWGPEMRLQRAMAIREQLVGCPREFELVSRWCEFLMKEYGDQAPVRVVASHYKTTEEVLAAFSGTEGQGADAPFKRNDEENFKSGKTTAC